MTNELQELLGMSLPSGRWLEIWSGRSELSAETEAEYRRSWIKRSGRDPAEFEKFMPSSMGTKPNSGDKRKKSIPDGPGTHLQRLIKAAGLRVAPGCKCKERAKLMDQRGPKWCRDNIGTIIGWLKEEHVRAREAKTTRLPWNHLATKGVVLLAIRRAEKERSGPKASTQPIATEAELPRMEAQPDAWTGGDWAVGITTAPRGQYTLSKTVRSLQSDGWNPIVFAEPKSNLAGFEAPIVQRVEPLGCWHNWYQMANSLLDNTDAKWIMTVQDDMEIATGARNIAERFLNGNPKAGFLSLYTAKHYQLRYDVIDKNGQRLCSFPNATAANDHARRRTEWTVRQYEWPRPSINRISTSSLWGACVLAFPRDSLRKILDHKIARNWKGANGKQQRPATKNSDTAIGKICRATKLEMFFANPSLATHIAKISSIGHGDNNGRRNCLYYVGNGDQTAKAIFDGVI